MKPSARIQREELSGLGPSDRVMFVLPSTKTLASLFKIAWNSGAALALLKPTVSEQDLDELVGRYQPTLLLSTDGETVRFERRPRGPHPKPVTDGSVTVFTSGTTGTPKGVVLPRSSAVGNALKTASLHGMGNGRPHGTCLQLFHVNALFMSLLGTMLTGELLALQEGGTASEYFDLLRQSRVRSASANPVVLRQIVQEAPAWPPDLDYFITAAGPCSANLAADFYELYGPRLRQGYGMSEAVNFSFLMPQVSDPKRFERLYLDMRPPVGTTLPETQFKIVENELWIQSPDLMAGYLHNPRPSNLVDGWLRTGDFAEQCDEFVTLFGRLSERISIRGLPEAPGVVEDDLSLSRGAGDHAIAQVHGHDRLALYTSGPIDNEDFHRAIGSGLPIAVIGAKQLLRSPSGKVRRSEMSEAAARTVAEVETLFAPSVHPDRANIISAANYTGLVSPTELNSVRTLNCGCSIREGTQVVTLRSEEFCPIGHGHVERYLGTRTLVWLAPRPGTKLAPLPSHQVTSWVQVDAGTFTVVESRAQ